VLEIQNLYLYLNLLHILQNQNIKKSTENEIFIRNLY